MCSEKRGRVRLSGTRSAIAEIVGFAVGKPQSPSFLDSLARAGGSVNALLDFVKRVHFPGFGRLLVRECLDVALAMLITIIDDPRLFV